MKKLNFESILKYLFVSVLLYILYCFSQNGRYQFSNETLNIIDTHTGSRYQNYGSGCTKYELDGSTTFIKGKKYEE